MATQKEFLFTILIFTLVVKCFDPIFVFLQSSILLIWIWILLRISSENAMWSCDH